MKEISFSTKDSRSRQKKQKAAHGYGLKSLRYTVHKYGGEVNINTDGNWFCLGILIPLKMS